MPQEVKKACARVQKPAAVCFFSSVRISL